MEEGFVMENIEIVAAGFLSIVISLFALGLGLRAIADAIRGLKK